MLAYPLELTVQYSYVTFQVPISQVHIPSVQVSKCYLGVYQFRM